MLSVGNVYCISLANILVELEGLDYDELLNEDSRHYLAYGYADVSGNEGIDGNIYIDFYDNNGNPAIMDGENAELLDIDDYAATFICREAEYPVYFKLSIEEAYAATGTN